MSDINENVPNPLTGSREEFQTWLATRGVNQLVAEGEVPEFRPDVPPRARTIAYYASGIGGATVGLTVAVVAAVAPAVDPASGPLVVGVTAAVGVAVLSFISVVAGVFGIVYRPTR